MRSNEMLLFFVATLISILLFVVQSFKIPLTEIILNPYIVALSLFLVLLGIIFILQTKTFELAEDIEKITLEQKKMNEKINIYERLDKLEVRVEKW